jgi:hypothetical protein
MRKLYIVILLFFLANRAIGQTCLPCLPQGITFSFQDQIDHFQINYPGCSQIEGNVTINGIDITNLDGLNILTSIGGNLTIIDCNNLTNLTGLDSLASIGGTLWIESCPILKNLSTLENLTSVLDGLYLYDCIALKELVGLRNATFSGGSFNIILCPSLKNLKGLEHLTTITGVLTINSNDSLTTLSGLENLSSVWYMFDINSCNSLMSLSGLENLIYLGSWLSIENCPKLLTLSGLENLTSVELGISIDNCSSLIGLTYLTSLTSVGGNGIGINNCPNLTTLSGLNNLTSIGGGLSISNCDTINNLTGLDSITSIGGGISIINCSKLTSLNGLEKVTSNGGGLSIESCPNLTDLSGLRNLSFIGGGISIRFCTNLTSISALENITSINGDIELNSCSSLTSLSGLENLTSIGDWLQIISCPALKSLTGIDNIDPNSFTGLNIYNNDSLSECNIRSICNYLLNPNVYAYFDNNSKGCNSSQEVKVTCAVPICLVSFDNLTEKNIIVWEKSFIDSIDHFNIYAKSLITLFYLIGSVPYDSLSIVIDTISIPSQTSYIYKISPVYQNGLEEKTTNNLHKTIHLAVSQGTGNSYDLIWNNYAGFTYQSFNIYRGINPSNLSYLTTVPNINTSYTDLTPPPGYAYYQIEVQKQVPCLPSSKTSSYASSKSNIASTYPLGIFRDDESAALFLYPNPTIEKVTIKIPYYCPEKNTYLEFRSLDGRLLKRQTVKETVSQVDISSFPQGVYIVKVIGEKRVQVGKLIKQ